MPNNHAALVSIVKNFFNNHKRSTIEGVYRSLGIDKKTAQKILDELMQENFIGKRNDYKKDANGFAIATIVVFYLKENSLYKPQSLFNDSDNKGQD